MVLLSLLLPPRLSISHFQAVHSFGDVYSRRTMHRMRFKHALFQSLQSLLDQDQFIQRTPSGLHIITAYTTCCPFVFRRFQSYSLQNKVFLVI